MFPCAAARRTSVSVFQENIASRYSTTRFSVLTLRQDIFAGARREVASPDGRYPPTLGVSDELSVKLGRQGSYYGR